MKIETKEKTKLQHILETKELGVKPYDSIILLIKYYKNQGMNDEEIYDTIDNFILNSDYKEYNTVVDEENIRKKIKEVKKGEIKDVEEIYIYKEEIDCIKEVTKVQKQKILFSYLVFLKILKVKNNNKKNIISSDKDIDVFNEANTSMTTEKRDLLIKELASLGYFKKITLKDKKNNRPVRCYELLYIKEETPDNPVEMVVDDFRELGLQWLEYCGDKKIKRCEVCGKRYKITGKAGRPPKYCKECDKKIKYLQRESSRIKK